MLKRHLFTLFAATCLGAVMLSLQSCMQQASPTGTEQVPDDPYFIEVTEAETIARDFLRSSDLRSMDDLRLSLLSDDKSLQNSSDESGQPAYYVYGLEKGGFVIVSATKLAHPVLGYSLENNFDSRNQNMISYLGTLSNQIGNARRVLLANDPNEKDPYIDKGETVKGKGKVVVPMMLRTRWDQDRVTGGKLPPQIAIGCLAVATGQIMKFWSYPDKAVGVYGYTDRNLGYVEHNYDYNIDWDAMPLINTEPNPTVARFFYGLAISMNMAFGPSSGALMFDVPSALHRHYGYPKDMYVLQRMSTPTGEWLPVVKSELDKGHPVLYGGQGKGGGHAFVLDGYTDNNYFHVNWGWGGMSDGWFLIDALSPEALGAGGGSGGFNMNHHMMINFRPPLTTTGEDTDPVDEIYDTPTNEVVYSPVYGLSQLRAFLSFTRIAGRETASGPDGYSDFTKQLMTGKRGDTIDYMVSPTYTSEEQPLWIYIWMDVDNDGYFADYELVARHDEVTSDVSGSFDIPDVISDGPHRVRVMMSLDGAPSPQKIVFNGEVEDYAIIVK